MGPSALSLEALDSASATHRYRDHRTIPADGGGWVATAHGLHWAHWSLCLTHLETMDLRRRGDLVLYPVEGMGEHDGVMTQTQHQTDSELQAAVVDELEWTPSVNSSHIGVSADHGAITLSGEVTSYPEKHNAEKAALRVRGVHAVAAEITVRNNWGAGNDIDIAREASEALERAVDVPSDSVKASVEKQFITLSGPVAWQFQRVAAERAVRYLRGVTGVANTITVTPTVSATGLQKAISSALVRNAQLEGKRITVTATAGVATLEGTVHSWSESQQANTAAWSAPGVTRVVNNLRISS
jgi:osmotically-inducible protein OsmY